MPRTIPALDVSDEEISAIAEAIKPYRKQINETPELLSILYDIDLLPEQIGYMANARRMIAVCVLMKQCDQASVAVMAAVTANKGGE